VLKAAVEWSQEIVNTTYGLGLGNYLGKAAASVDDLASVYEIQVPFLLALKYYLTRSNKVLTNVAELEEFTIVVAWANVKNDIPVKVRNLGVANYTLQRWDDCIRCFNC